MSPKFAEIHQNTMLHHYLLNSYLNFSPNRESFQNPKQTCSIRYYRKK